MSNIAYESNTGRDEMADEESFTFSDKGCSLSLAYREHESIPTRLTNEDIASKVTSLDLTETGIRYFKFI